MVSQASIGLGSTQVSCHEVCSLFVQMLSLACLLSFREPPSPYVLYCGPYRMPRFSSACFLPMNELPIVVSPLHVAHLLGCSHSVCFPGHCYSAADNGHLLAACFFPCHGHRRPRHLLGRLFAASIFHGHICMLHRHTGH